MEKYYTLNELALMTGLTTRTLRNYLKMNVLCGEKMDGIWKFTEEDISKFFQNPYVKPGIQAKNKAIVFDFLAENRKKTNEICTILDLYVSGEEAADISDFFCSEVAKKDGKIRFSFEKEDKNVRIVLSGTEDNVREVLNAYYEQ